jgi:16S rRNA (guanine527-N7)-methyltransferase
MPPITGIRAVTMQDTRRRIERRMRRAGLEVGDVLLERLAGYLLLLEVWNRRMNLTALDRPDDAVDRLLVEPLLAARHIAPEATRLMDIGSGGGSPAIPLKLARPDLELTMVEAKTRKSVFLREVIRHLDLRHCGVETTRYEQLLARPSMLETFSVVSMRAVRIEAGDLRTLQAFLSPGGQMLWFLSGSQPVPMVPPPLVLETAEPLLEALRSRVVVLRKHHVGPGVPRGT